MRTKQEFAEEFADVLVGEKIDVELYLDDIYDIYRRAYKEGFRKGKRVSTYSDDIDDSCYLTSGKYR